MNNTNESEIKLLDIQIYATIILIGSLFLSLALTYDEKLNLLNKRTIFDDKTENNLIIINRILFLIVSFIFLYTSYKNREIAKEKKESLDSFELQITASELTTLAAIIALYVVFQTNGQNVIVNIENPTL